MAPDDSIPNNGYPSLLPQHLKIIVESGISAEVAQARGYRSSRSKADLKALGFSSAQAAKHPGLVIPIHTVNRQIENYQLRPDEPRLQPNGKPSKYETMFDRRMCLDVHPFILGQIGDPAIPLLVTEGVRKQDSAVTKGLCCVDILGVWSWRGTNKHGGRVALPDWHEIALNGREIYLAFDSDVMKNIHVYAALKELKAYLQMKKGSIWVIYFPEPDGEKVGLDDFLVNHSTDDLFTLASRELREPPANDDDDEEPEYPYRENEAGIWFYKTTRDGSGTIVHLANFSAHITEDIVEDDGAEVRRVFGVQASMQGQMAQFSVPAHQFMLMNWPTEHLGPQAVIAPGQGLKDHARAAIQYLSLGGIDTRHVYRHTGWRHIDGRWVFLHAGGGIDADGLVSDLDVQLPESLQTLIFPSIPKGEALCACVQASLKLWDVADSELTIPLAGTLYRAPLADGDSNHSLHLAGATGLFKTSVAVLFLQHYGSGFDALHPPASWSSTDNALEGLAFLAKDMLLLVDDFKPQGTLYDIAAYHRRADRLFRGQANRQGRSRSRPDGTLQPLRLSRCTLLSTGEDNPKGESLGTRICLIGARPDMVNVTSLSNCQADASIGLYAQAFAGYLQWLAACYPAMRQSLQRDLEGLRDQAYKSGQHRRTPTVVANMGIGIRYYLEYARDIGAINADEQAERWQAAWNALGDVAAAQSTHQVAYEPVQRFLSLLRSVLASGHAHLAGSDGAEPSDSPEAWGWRKHESTSSTYPSYVWRAQGDCIGWIDQEDVYLEPQSAYQCVQRHGEPLDITATQLYKRLHERKLLLTIDQARETLMIRKTLQGKRRPVLHIASTTVYPLDIDKPDQPDQTTDDDTDKPFGRVSDETSGRVSEHGFPEKSADPTTKNNLNINDIESNGRVGRDLSHVEIPYSDARTENDGKSWSGFQTIPDQEHQKPDHDSPEPDQKPDQADLVGDRSAVIVTCLRCGSPIHPKHRSCFSCGASKSGT